MKTLRVMTCNKSALTLAQRFYYGTGLMLDISQEIILLFRTICNYLQIRLHIDPRDYLYIKSLLVCI